MNLIDTHSHLYLDAFNDDRDVVIKNAIENSVKKILLPNIDSDSFNNMLDLCKEYPNICYPMFGLHPTSVKENYKKEIEVLEKFLEKNNFIAIGETGIDLYWDKKFLQEQIIVFKYQIELAKKMDLPLVIHIRESFKEVFKVLDGLYDKKLKGVFHCFSGTQEDAEKAISYGFKLGIGGVVTFKNSSLGEIVKNTNLKHILLETDAPFLAPVPYRGKRNESSYLINIASKVAELHNESIDKIAEITTANTYELFKI